MSVVISLWMMMTTAPRPLLKSKGKTTLRKKAAIYLMKRYTCLDNKEIGEVFGGLHYSAVSKAAARLEKELSKDKDLTKLVGRLV